MPNPWTDDIGYDQPDDPYWSDNQEMWETTSDFNEGYETIEGIEARVTENQLDNERLYRSDFKINDEGKVVPKTEFDKFLRDNKLIIGALLFLGYMI